MLRQKNDTNSILNVVFEEMPAQGKHKKVRNSEDKEGNERQGYMWLRQESGVMPNSSDHFDAAPTDRGRHNKALCESGQIFFHSSGNKTR